MFISILHNYCEDINTNIVKYENKTGENDTDKEPYDHLLDKNLLKEINNVRKELKEKDKLINESQFELNEVKEKQKGIRKIVKNHIKH